MRCFSLFQANQLAEIINTQVFVHISLFKANPIYGKLLVGLLLSSIISTVIFGGIRRIGQVAAKLVPTMVIIYLLCGIVILLTNYINVDNLEISFITSFMIIIIVDVNILWKHEVTFR